MTIIDHSRSEDERALEMHDATEAHVKSLRITWGISRDEKDEAHISPLQLDVIERCIDLWSMPGDVVLTPFLGIGSEVYGAVEMGRRAIGFELKPLYYRQAVKNVREALARRDSDSLLSMMEARSP